MSTQEWESGGRHFVRSDRLTAGQIAARLGANETRVADIAHRLGVSPIDTDRFAGEQYSMNDAKRIMEEFTK